MARKTRTPATATPVDTVTQLMAERTKYEQWLDDLEAKKDSTPAKVYDRVHRDYLGRLQSVMEQLKGHTATLQSHVASLGKRLIELESAEESRTEERAEAELRAKVGEMTPAEWDVVSKKADRELAKLRQDQEQIRTEVARIEGLVSDLEGGGGDEKKTKSQVDEMAFLKAVVGATPPAPSPAQKQPAAEGPASATEISAAGPSDTPPAPPTAPTPATDASSAPTPVAGAPVVGRKTPPVAAGALAGSTAGDQSKTLKCTECGAMNYPSEWYCERCGAELTVV